MFGLIWQILYYVHEEYQSLVEVYHDALYILNPTSQKHSLNRGVFLHKFLAISYLLSLIPIHGFMSVIEI